MGKQIKRVMVEITFLDENCNEFTKTKCYNNTQDAQSFLQTQKCYNTESRHQ